VARIRTIKPEFWQDEKLAPLPALTRLVFIGLISQADDAGRLIDNVKMLDGQLFPLTDETCGPSLDELARLGRIIRYHSESGQRLLQITHWDTHQKVDRPSKYTLPPPPESEDPPELREENRWERDTTREEVATHSRDTREGSSSRPWTVDRGSNCLLASAGARDDDQEHDDASRVPTSAAAEVPPSDVVLEIITTANAAQRLNPAIDQARYRPIPAGHGKSVQQIADWLNDGIALDTIVEVVQERCGVYQPSDRSRQINSLTYLDGAVREEHSRRTIDTSGHTPTRGRLPRRSPDPGEYVPTTQAVEF
jgi:hypothetical protein